MSLIVTMPESAFNATRKLYQVQSSFQVTPSFFSFTFPALSHSMLMWHIDRNYLSSSEKLGLHMQAWKFVACWFMLCWIIFLWWLCRHHQKYYIDVTLFANKSDQNLSHLVHRFSLEFALLWKAVDTEINSAHHQCFKVQATALLFRCPVS